MIRQDVDQEKETGKSQFCYLQLCRGNLIHPEGQLRGRTVNHETVGMEQWARGLIVASKGKNRIDRVGRLWIGCFE
jgi:hypothetical protein